MGEEPRLSRNEIARRISTGIGLVYDLYNELHGFLRMVIEGLSASDLDIAIIRNGLMVLRDPSEKTKTKADRYMTTDLGFVGELGVDGTETEDIDEEQDDPQQDSRGHQISKDSQFLAFHIALRTRNKGNEKDVTPKVIVGRLTEFRQERLSKKSGRVGPAAEFKVQRKYILRLTRQMDESAVAGDTISIRVPRHKLSAKVQAVKIYELATFDSEKAVGKLIENMVTMCS